MPSWVLDPEHVSEELALNISPNPSEVISEVSEPYDNFSEYPPFPHKNVIVQELEGVPK